MNIFIMILLSVFMVGYYFVSSPGMRTETHETEYAVNMADMRGIAECVANAHTATINGQTFEDVCVSQNQIVSKLVCLNKKLSAIQCELTARTKPDFSFIVTTTAPLSPDMYNDMMNIIETYYTDSGTFGIFQDGTIVVGGTTSTNFVPQGIITDMNMTNGQLVYITQFKIPDATLRYSTSRIDDIMCPAGTTKVYRFGRWQCIEYNTKTDCGGDMIWDSKSSQCVADESRKPLCVGEQTAVIVDDVWECIDPFTDITCPETTVARLNYETLEWECVEDPNLIRATTKCAHIKHGVTYGRLGTTLRRAPSSCTDCERQIINEDTCESICVPDASKLSDPRCYPGNTDECTGTTRAFYFGFPNHVYAASFSDIDGYAVPIDRAHAQNRKFNCMECPDAGIDTEKSFPPYITVCK